VADDRVFGPVGLSNGKITRARGGSDAVTTILTNNADVLIDTLTLAMPLTDDGKLIPLAKTGAQRSPFLPDLPTIKEFGVTGCEVSGEVILMAPRGTPPEIVEPLYRAMEEVGKLPALKSRMLDLKAELVTNSPAEAMREWRDTLKV
jgi:tripartite-type tricarboxylate transporter receptor subunit TctC